MSTKGKIFIRLVTVLGWIHLAFSTFQWHSNDLVRFFSYFVVAVLASRLNIKHPTLTHTVSVSLLFIVLGIVELNVSETLILGCTAALAQCLWHPGMRSKPSHIFVALGILATAIAAAEFAYRSLLPTAFDVFAVRLAVAACTFFVANTFPIAVSMSLVEGKRIGQTWREAYFWSFPYYMVGAAMAGLLSAEKSSLGWQSMILVLPILHILYKSYRGLLGRMEDQEKHADEMCGLHIRTIEALALAIEAKDRSAPRHLRRVQVYAVEIGKELDLSTSQIEALRAASLLHDIGELAVPEHILTKPGTLTAEEFARMTIHPIVGAEILERVKFPYPVAPIVRAHHEKWDGSGYPDGLKGKEIPIAARILAAVDGFDELTLGHDCREALPLDQAMLEVAAQAGRSYDPKVVEVLKRRYMELEHLAKAQWNAEPNQPWDTTLAARAQRNSPSVSRIFAVRRPKTEGDP